MNREVNFTKRVKNSSRSSILPSRLFPPMVALDRGGFEPPYLHVHPAAANLLLIVSSAIIDLAGHFSLSEMDFRSIDPTFPRAGNHAGFAAHHAVASGIARSTERDLALFRIPLTACDS